MRIYSIIARSLVPVLLVALLPGMPIQPAIAQTVANPGLLSLAWSSAESELSTRVAWGDMDNDGDLDLAVANYTFPSRVYRNNNGVLSPAWESPAAERSFGVAWGDYDSDGDLDLMITNGSSFAADAASQEGQASRLYRNVNGTLETTPIWSTPAARSFGMAWGDADGDGDLDLAVANGGISASDSGGDIPTFAPEPEQNVIYVNDTPQTSDAPPVFRSVPLPGAPDASVEVAWGDYDGDGKLDLAIGNLGIQVFFGGFPIFTDGQRDRIYRNTTPDGATTPSFTLVQELAYDPTFGVAWGEIDGQPGLDLVLGNASTPGGSDRLLYSNTLYRNISGTLTLDNNWTPEPLSTIGIALGDYDGDGDLDLAAANAAPLGSDEVGSLNTIYENVGGTFSDTPIWQAPQRDDSFGVAWGDYDNDGDLDLATANSGILNFSSFPGQPNRLYRNESGVLNRTAVTSLTGAGTTSRVAWGDYDNDGDLDLALGALLTPDDQAAPNKIYRNQGGVLEDIGANLGLSDGFANVAWGDIDNDNDLDLAVSNYFVGSDEIYRNTGGNFTPYFTFGTGTETSSLVWGDYDSDGLLDLAVSNRTQPVEIYRNTGTSFTRLTPIPSSGDDILSVAWGDYDSDGDLDLVMGAYGQRNSLYVNTNGTFTRVWRSNESDLTTSVAWGDEDGDGDLDLAVGNAGQPKRIYRNEGGTLSTGPAWSSIEGDLTTSLSWGDYDGDGDLDLAVGNGGFSASFLCSTATGSVNQPNRVYLNNGSGLEQRAFWTSTETEFTTGVSWGDYDGDGDLDLVSATCAGGVSRVYENRRADLAPLGAVAPTVTLQQPDGQPAADGLAAGRVLTATVIPVSYTLRHSESRPARLVRFFYSIDGGDDWLPARDSTGSNQRIDIAASPTGVTHSFSWDTYASNFFGQSDNMLLRVEVYPMVRPVTHRAAGPFQQTAATATSKPFRVRGTQVQVVNQAGVGVSNALVYRLPAGSVRGALPMNGGAGEAPFRTDDRGFLQGRGELMARPVGASTGGDQLLAMVPVLITDTYTLYHTSGPISIERGLEMAPVAQPGVQRLTISPNNPLLLFRLDVALEWDARNDTRYMAQLERDLLRTSEILYDYTDGQAALGEVTFYHDAKRRLYDGWDLWAFSQLRIYATNRMRPNANKGGNVITSTPDPYAEAGAIEYLPGQIRMGAVWNRYGDRSGVLGEDWPRTLGHELGHYLFFLDDNYLGLNDDNVLIAVNNCQGAMSDPYRDEYSEFHPGGTTWDARCSQTLSEQLTERSDWETINAFFPTNAFGIRAPTSYNANPGPNLLPLAVTQVSDATPDTPSVLTAPLDVPLFTIEGGTSQSARAFVFQGPWLTDLGLVTGDRLETRGTAVGDKLCVYDLPAQKVGCETVQAGNQSLEVRSVPNWQPEISLTPVTSRTLVVNVTGIVQEPQRAENTPSPNSSALLSPPSVSSVAQIPNLSVQLYPLDYPALAAVPLVQEGGRYSATFQLNEPIFEGYLHISANDSSGREAVIDFTIGGNPGRLWSRTVTKGNPGRLWSRTAPRSNPGRLWSRTAPVISGDGQVIVFTANETFAEGEFYALQTVSQIDNPPAWAVPVGQAYRVTSVAGAPPLTGASISMGYLSAEVPDGAERSLRLYRFNGTGWESLPSTLNTEFNLVSAAINGPGVYAIMASVELPPLTVVGWNTFSYPLANSRPVNEALLSIEGSYSMVYREDSGSIGERWKLYATGVPTYVNDLTSIDFARSYEIYITRPVTISLRPDLPAAQRPDTSSTAQTTNAPSAFYGTMNAGEGFTPTPDALVEAFVGGTLCGRGRTQSFGGSIVYSIKVEANCGSGQTIAFRVGGRAMAPTGQWSNTSVQELNLGPGGSNMVYLPMIVR